MSTRWSSGECEREWGELNLCIHEVCSGRLCGNRGIPC